jgi:hypothetical protein
MEAALVSGVTYSIVEDAIEITLRRLKNPKFHKEHNGLRWTKANRRYFAKSKHWCEKTVTNAFNALIKAGIIIKDQLSKDEGDMTNWYAINPDCAKDGMLERIKAFFGNHIGNLIHNIIINKNYYPLRGNNNFFNKSRKTPSGKKSEENDRSLALGARAIDRSLDETAPAEACESSSSTTEEQTILEFPVVKTKTAQEALAIWNEVTERDDRMSKPLARFLVAAIKLKFENLDRWREFCWRVKSSYFLMSARFRSVLYFALKFDVIDKILKGMYGVRDAEGKLVSDRRQKSVVAGRSGKRKVGTINMNACNGVSNDDGARHTSVRQASLRYARLRKLYCWMKDDKEFDKLWEEELKNPVEPADPVSAGEHTSVEQTSLEMGDRDKFTSASESSYLNSLPKKQVEPMKKKTTREELEAKKAEQTRKYIEMFGYDPYEKKAE